MYYVTFICMRERGRQPPPILMRGLHFSSDIIVVPLLQRDWGYISDRVTNLSVVEAIQSRFS